MKAASLLSALLAASCAGAAPGSYYTDERSAEVIPDRFIIEVDTTTNVSSVLTGLRARDVDFEIAREFQQPEVFIGASVTIKVSYIYSSPA